MKQVDYAESLWRHEIFNGCDKEALARFTHDARPERKRVAKNGFVFMQGDTFRLAGIILAGSFHIVQDDFWGNRTIMSRLERGDCFGETWVCAGVDSMPVSVIACENSEILLFDIQKMISLGSLPSELRACIVNNLLSLAAKKNVVLLKKLGYVTQRTTREKLLSYLSDVAVDRRKTSLPRETAFDIPFNRNELADYLAVERSAMSAALSRMRDEGIISFRKNRFILHTVNLKEPPC